MNTELAADNLTCKTGAGDPQCKIIGFSYLNTNTNSIEVNWNVSSLNLGIRSENNCRLFDFDLGYKNIHEIINS